MNPHDLLKVATILLASNRGRPTATCLRRAVRSCYYALFHCLSRDCADLLIGGAGSQRSREAWRQVYRSLEHGPAKARCMDGRAIKRFPQEIQTSPTPSSRCRKSGMKPTTTRTRPS